MNCSLRLFSKCPGGVTTRLLILPICREEDLKGLGQASKVYTIENIENRLKKVYKINMIAQGLVVWVYQQKALKKMH